MQKYTAGLDNSSPSSLENMRREKGSCSVNVRGYPEGRFAKGEAICFWLAGFFIGRGCVFK